MKNIYLAPLEGITDNIFRQTYRKYYGGADKLFTPFLSPCSTNKFTAREWDEINPEKNDPEFLVPQLLTNHAEHFLWAVGELVSMGYREINFNLGCPSGTVVAKKKGSGLLFYPELLDQMLDEIFNGISSLGQGNCTPVHISIKSRLGKSDPEEFYQILDIYNKYPIYELTLHPRIQSDFYREPLRPEYISYALSNSKAPVIYNGEIKTITDIYTISKRYPSLQAIMIGRGLITTPSLAADYKAGKENSSLDMDLFREFHKELLSQYIQRFSGDQPVLHRMKEFWALWKDRYPDKMTAIKKIQKAKSVGEYKSGAVALNLICYPQVGH